MPTRRPSVPRATRAREDGQRELAQPLKRPASQGASARSGKPAPKRPASPATENSASAADKVQRRTPPPSKAAQTADVPSVKRTPPAKASPSEVRAAERSQLAGAIRTAKAPFRRNPERGIVPAEDAEPIPAKAFSGRLLALAVVLITITILLAPSIRTFLQQQAETRALQDQIAALEQEQADLQTQLARWEDPAYIKQQARDRLFLVMPGETRYLVKGGTELEPSEEQQSQAGARDLPWTDALWESVERAATD